MGVTIGPILGPVLGGWLTENYEWRWVFYINVPFGILSFLGILSFMAETPLRTSRFDFFGFSTLSLSIGALQLLLDRGQLKDWFSSSEIWLAACIAAVSFYLFVIHMLTTRSAPFVSPALFKDRNFVTGAVFIFVMGAVLYATLALLPPLLQALLNYPVVLTGLVTAPRGVGTMIAMLIVGRLVARMDVRIIIAAGFGITALALWQMTGFYLQMDSSTVIYSGILQGLGVGLVFVPLASISFATVSAQLRDEGTTFFSLMRNLGSSVGISAIQTLLTRNTQIMHSRLAEHITSYGGVQYSQLSNEAAGLRGLVTMNNTITIQAAMIAYNNDFKLMMVMSLCAIPLVGLLRSGRRLPEAQAVMIE